MTRAPQSRPVVRSGRPYRPPEDRVDPHATVVDPRIRTAWLLGTSRLYAVERSFGSRRSFVAALRDLGISCDETRVSRWESGATMAPTPVLIAYERLLGLPAYHLRGGVDLGRPAAPHGVPVPAGGEHERFHELIEGALAGGLDGLGWLELAERMSRADTVFLRERDWSALARGLLHEQARSIGPGYAARTVALSRLVGHPVARRHVARAIGEVMLDDRAPQRARTVLLLAHLPGAASTALALRLLEHAEEPVRGAAAAVLAALVADGGVDDARLGQLEPALARGLRRDPDQPALADLAVRLPAETRERLQAATGNRLLGLALTGHELVGRDVAAALATQVADAAGPLGGAGASGTRATTGTVEDGMLPRLVREALFHVHWRRRLSAMSLLAASPYAAGLAGACAVLLTHADPIVAGQAVWAQGWLARQAQAGPLAAVVVAGPESRAVAALQALGSLPGSLTPETLTVVLDALRGGSRRPGGVATAAAHTLGMHGLAATIPAARPALADLAGWWGEAGRLSS